MRTTVPRLFGGSRLGVGEVFALEADELHNAGGYDFNAGEQVFLGDGDLLHGVGAHAEGNPGLGQLFDGFGLRVVFPGEEAGRPAVGEKDDGAGFAVQRGEIVADIAEGPDEAGFIRQIHMHEQVVKQDSLL